MTVFHYINGGRILMHLEERINEKKWTLLNRKLIEGSHAGNIYRIEALDDKKRKRNYIYKEFERDRNNEIVIYEQLSNLISPYSKLVEIWDSFPQAILMHDLKSPLKNTFEKASLKKKRKLIEHILQRLSVLHTSRFDVESEDLPKHQITSEWQNWCIHQLKKLITQQQWAKTEWIETIEYAYDQLDLTNYKVKCPLVITHGDPHLENIFESDDQIYFIDWEWTAVGSPLRDITILLQDVYEPELIQFVIHSYHSLLELRNLNILEKDYRKDFDFLYIDHTTMMLAWEIEKYFQGYTNVKSIMRIAEFKMKEIKRIMKEEIIIESKKPN
ncbi:phosphotransferase family protein [Chengkuizengella axinellae]|uniref:Phosphotransferase n=1 Tax=Chengkuizengella axinellae TaxID=3064388 RepID=A0ABT9J555_9BACL|nr:phosphotransferase [Chengkuizengella sp. 2205SS18-9]MDP5276743.1 phosphotransferase [Chengkuizengella sp. 2205SS18-9]